MKKTTIIILATLILIATIISYSWLASAATYITDNYVLLSKDLNISTDGSNTSNPRSIFFTGLSSGESSRIALDGSTGYQTIYNNATQLYAYHSIVLQGQRRISLASPPTVSYNNATSAGIIILNQNGNTPVLDIISNLTQTANLTQWINGSGSIIAHIDKEGNFIGKSISATLDYSNLTGFHVACPGNSSNRTYIVQTNASETICVGITGLTTDNIESINASDVLNSPWITSIPYQNTAGGWTNTSTTTTTTLAVVAPSITLDGYAANTWSTSNPATNNYYACVDDLYTTSTTTCFEKGGSTGTTISSTTGDINHPGVQILRANSSGGVNTGYGVGTGASQILIGGGEKMRAIIAHLAIVSLNISVHRIGFADTTTTTEATDGLFFRCWQNTTRDDCVAVRRSNGVEYNSTTDGKTAYNPTIAQYHRYEVTALSTSSINWSIYNQSGSLVWSHVNSNTTSIPATTGRELGVRVNAHTTTGTSASSNLAWIDYISLEINRTLVR